MRENRFKQKLARGEIATALAGFNTPDMIDFIGPLGFDAVWIEAEHGPIDYGDIPNLTRACDLWGMTSIVRVNLNLPGVIYRTLDLGAQGIVVPHVNTADEARAVVEAGKFAPIGWRGNFTSRQGYGVDSYPQTANDQSLLIVLIEDIVAVNNLSEILKVDHIDVFFVAPGDLAQSMGHLGNIGHPEVQATIDRALEHIIAAGRTPGTLVTDATVERYLQQGVRALYVGWPAWLNAGAKNFLHKVASVAG